MSTPHTTRTARAPALAGARSLALAGAVALGALVGAPASARADAQSAKCTFMEIRATNKEGGVDPRLKGLAKKAKRPPLSSWKTLTLIKKWDKTVTKMETVQFDLQKGGQLVAVYGGHVQRDKGKPRWSMTVRMETKSGKEVANANYSGPSGDFLVVGYTLPDDSGHLVAVQCTVK